MQSFPQGQNILKQRLAAGELSLCLRVASMVSPEIGHIANAAGFDALYVDLEHSSASIGEACNVALATAALRPTTLVRIKEGALSDIGVLLDGGCKGIIAPHIDTVDQCKALLDACYFPPVGHRSIGGPPVLLGYQQTSEHEMYKALNEATLVAAMVESRIGISNVEGIASQAGLDMIFVGMHDLCADLGVENEREPEAVKALGLIASVCKSNRVALGIGGVSSKDSLKTFIDMGATFISAAADNLLLLQGGRNRVAELQGFRKPPR